jgi:hypothetical protein
MTRSFLLSLSGSLLLLTTMNAVAEDITVSGCASVGVEANCLVLKDGDKIYNITSAQPTPMPGTYGTLRGTLSDKVSTCQQGQVVDPATWEVEAGRQCPVETSQ